MAKFNFEGEFKDITPRQIEFIEGVLEEQGFKDGTVQVQAVGKAGDNYTSNVKRIIIEKDGKAFKMIAKVAPNNEMIRAMANMRVIFVNEHVMYTEVLPKFTELQKAAGIPEKDRFKYPKCYGSLTELSNEIILLEDLQVSDYTILDRMVSFDDETIKMVLRNIAVLHSLSYVLRTQEPETFVSLAGKLTNSFLMMAAVPQIMMYFEKIEETVLMLLEGLGDKYKDATKGAMSRLMASFGEVEERVKESRYSVIHQGDAWANNLMFKLEENKPQECCMVDYQLSRESSPAYDLHYMIFNCTDYEIRSKHYHEWIDYYHSQLDKSLSDYGLRASYIYPREQLNIELKRQGKISFAIALMMAGIQNIDSADAEKMKVAMEQKGANLGDIFESMVNCNDTGLLRYRKKIQGLVDSFIELEYL